MSALGYSRKEMAIFYLKISFIWIPILAIASVFVTSFAVNAKPNAFYAALCIIGILNAILFNGRNYGFINSSNFFTIWTAISAAGYFAISYFM